MRVSHWSAHGMDAAHRKRARWHRAVEGVSRMQLILRSAHGKQKARGGQQRKAQEQCWRTMLKLSQTHLHHEPSVISQRQRLQMRIKRVAKEGCLQCCVAVVGGIVFAAAQTKQTQCIYNTKRPEPLFQEKKDKTTNKATAGIVSRVQQVTLFLSMLSA